MLQHSHITKGGEGRFGAPKQSDANMSSFPVEFNNGHGITPLKRLLSIVATSVFHDENVGMIIVGFVVVVYFKSK